jgi:hypothetical protein
MDLTMFVDRVRQELAVAAAAGGPDAVALAERLTAPLASALQLVLLEALSGAADEITRELAPGSVELRLRGGEPGFAVTLPPATGSASVAPPMAPAVAPPGGADADDALGEPEAATARINLRVPEALKARIEDAATAQGRSVNAWLTRAAAAALSQPAPDRAADRTTGGRTNQHVTGWVI